MMIGREETEEFINEAHPDANGLVDYRALARFLVESCRD